MNLFTKNSIIPILLLQGLLFAHCQVPCGIYNDAARIIELQEDFATIQKAMVKINELSLKQDATSINQMTRWIMTKEEHASNIQKVVSDYFLIQRIKIKTSQSEFGHYADLTTTLHQIMVSAMKCKQSVETDHITTGLEDINTFVNLYFDKHGKKHLKEMSGS
jgi:nickel superoxide dismutase